MVRKRVNNPFHTLFIMIIGYDGSGHIVIHIKNGFNDFICLKCDYYIPLKYKLLQYLRR